MKLPVVLISLIFAADAATIREDRNTRIVGGHDADIEDYPYQIGIQRNGNHTCGGSIIAENYVLTAAHCVLSDNLTIYTVKSGSSDRGNTGTGQMHEIVEKYETDIPADLIIVKVDPPFIYDETRQPIELVDERPEVGSLGNVTGWGGLNEKNDRPSKLQVVDVPIISQKDCNEAFGATIGKTDVCAGYLGVGGKDSCNGDSGGPFAVNGELAGVVSWGWGCASPLYPGVYVDVSYFKDWVKRIIDN